MNKKLSMKKIFSISKDNHSGLVRKLTIVHEYMHFTDNSFFDNHTSFDSSGYKGVFNNYVDQILLNFDPPPPLEWTI